MERHSEIVRQWRILLALEGRSRGLTLAEAQEIAGDGVTDRTIRRDLDALAQAGFPIDTTKRDGKTVYILNREVFRGVAAAGFSLSELCALHLSRTVLTAVAGGPFRDSLASAFDKLYDALPPSMWKFIESLPDALGAKEHALAAARGVLSEGHRHADVGDPLAAAASACAITRSPASRSRTTSSNPIGWLTRRAGCICRPSCRITATRGRSRRSGSNRRWRSRRRFSPVANAPDVFPALARRVFGDARSRW